MSNPDQSQDDILYPPLGKHEIKKLITSLMIMPINMAQLAVPGLEKFTLSHLLTMFKMYMNEPPESCAFRPLSLISHDPFTDEEDFWLITYNKFFTRETNDIAEFCDQLYELGEHIHANRSIGQIQTRMNQIKKMPKEEVEEFYTNFAKKILREEIYYMSTATTEEMARFGVKPASLLMSRCNYDPIEKYTISEEASKEVANLSKIKEMLAQGFFESTDLAILRGRNVEFPMRREAIIIGRASQLAEVDIDVSLEGEHGCIHVSRQQAILSFLPDLNFYAENIGNGPFRVNGVIISPGEMCKLPPFAILDFAGVLLMFLPNLRFVETISEELKKKKFL